MSDALANLDKFLCEGLIESLKEPLQKACLILEREAKIEAPVDDGTLRASITHEITKDGTQLIGAVGTNVEYAPYVHEGTGIHAVSGDGRKYGWCYQDIKGDWHYTRGQKPNPFLQRAYEKTKDKIEEQFKGVI